MSLFAVATPIVLYSNLAADECARRLRDAIDTEQLAVFSFSGYHGSKGFLGHVDGRLFRVRQRTYARNVSPILCGELLPQGRGTAVRACFDFGRLFKTWLLLVMALGILVIVPGIYSSARGAFGGPTAIALSIVYVALVLLLPRILREVGRSQERCITDFLWTTLEAGDDQSAFERTQKC